MTPLFAFQKSQADNRQVVIKKVSVLASEGEYKCQISGESPSFTTETQTKRLRVAVVPKEAPKVDTTPEFVEPGDWLNINCTSNPSRPPVRLTWFVNGREVNVPDKIKFYSAANIKIRKIL